MLSIIIVWNYIPFKKNKINANRVDDGMDCYNQHYSMLYLALAFYRKESMEEAREQCTQLWWDIPISPSSWSNFTAPGNPWLIIHNHCSLFCFKLISPVTILTNLFQKQTSGNYLRELCMTKLAISENKSSGFGDWNIKQWGARKKLARICKSGFIVYRDYSRPKGNTP